MQSESHCNDSWTGYSCLVAKGYRFATIISAPVRATAPLLLTHVAQNARDIPDRLRKRRHPAILFHAGGAGIVSAQCQGQIAAELFQQLFQQPRARRNVLFWVIRIADTELLLH